MKKCENRLKKAQVDTVNHQILNGFYRGIGSVLPRGFSSTKYHIPLDRPALLLTRFNGTVEYSDGVNKGWDGLPFWAPVIQFPDGNYAFSVNRT